MNKIKKIFIALILLLSLTIVTGCNENKNDDSLRFENLRVVKGKKAGEFDVIFMSHTDCTIYYVVTPEDVEITEKSKIVNPDSKYVSGNGEKKIVETIDGLEAGTTYNIFIVLNNDKLYSKIVKYTLTTKTVKEASIIGSGTIEDPFQIHTIDDLNRICTGEDGFSTSANYILMTDIDLKEEGYDENNPFTPIGRAGSSIKKLSGDFNGNNHTISNLYVKGTSGEKWGLFAEVAPTGSIHDLTINNATVISNGFRIGSLVGYCKGAIYNITVNNVTITATNSGDSQAGGVVGCFYTCGSISNVSATNVTVTGTGRRLGLVVGSASIEGKSLEPISIMDCYSEGTIIGSGTDPRQVGGILGYGIGVVLSNCISKGSVKGSYQIGGIVGYLESTVYVQSKVYDNLYLGNSISLHETPVSQQPYAGKVLGYNNAKILDGVARENYLNNNYSYEFDIDRATSTKQVDGDVITSAQAIDKTWYSSNMTSLNFERFWEIVTGNDTPTLKRGAL